MQKVTEGLRSCQRTCNGIKIKPDLFLDFCVAGAAAKDRKWSRKKRGQTALSTQGFLLVMVD